MIDKYFEKTYVEKGGTSLDLNDGELDELFSGALSQALADLNDAGPVIVVPPDITRYHSRAGFFTGLASRELKGRLGAVLPALGTHMPLTTSEMQRMFPNVPKDKFLVHDWRTQITELGRLEADFVRNVTEGAVNYDWPVQVNKLLCKSKSGKSSSGVSSPGGGFSLILSIGQVVPHEVAGMANHAKNIFIGTGGKEAIDKSHFAGAAYGMERIMGRTENPVRSLFDEGFRRFADALPPILWVLTIMGRRTPSETEAAAKVTTEVTAEARGPLAIRGLYVGFGRDCFEKAAALSAVVNIETMDGPIRKVVVYLQPEEFRTTWLGNKAIYRTRMAIANGGELLILAPGLERFGEDIGVDSLIRKYGYRSGADIKAKVATDAALGENLSAAAHLIHGSSGGRFTIRYCPGPGLSRKEVESVGFEWGDLREAQTRYDVWRLTPGWNSLPDGERIFFIPNPGLGLWARR